MRNCGVTFVKDGGDELLLFCPARQMWKEKGNDKMITAFSKFVKVFPNSRFIMVAWSTDEYKSKKLVNDSWNIRQSDMDKACPKEPVNTIL